MARGTLSYDHEIDLIDEIPRQPDGQLVTKPKTVRKAIPGCLPNQIGDNGTNNNKGRQGCPLCSQNAEGLAEGIPYCHPFKTKYYECRCRTLPPKCIKTYRLIYCEYGTRASCTPVNTLCEDIDH